ncbi:hypothetical protein COO91_00723 [Nostoc flagelliforme CCNUN1]|uniref:Uncharacterized protein n=1 Tax=Nostoc flagelliforme CCNUN1 TaxID=2038116 RepID=A0A2K8SJ85_9NOSO|nr:hypothetical protein [Nostoc flagelliforme]AUB34885.1 hypothetical protein COO91_00723 [Nostoc flagelliforme CCNUN1]
MNWKDVIRGFMPLGVAQMYNQAFAERELVVVIRGFMPLGVA